MSEAKDSAAYDVALLTLLKIIVSAFVLAIGFRGISDDDFARVVIAQEFAHGPRLDPSGTSWLPLPFWLTGGVMLVFGRGLVVAQIFAVVLGVVSVWLVYLAGRWITGDRSSALAGAAVASVIVWSARLGVSTVPELPTAACTLVAIASLVPGRRATDRLVGALLLAAACLSRYEPWLIAVPFALVSLRDAWRAIRDKAQRAAAHYAAAAALAAVGPLGWSAWNHHAHGAATHYLDRVAAYKNAIDQGAFVGRAFSYLLATFRAEPELLVVLAFVVWLCLRKSVDVRGALSGFRWPAWMVGFLLVTLTVASIRGGAPTHHPERALFVLHLLVAVALGHLAVQARRAGALGPPHLLAGAAVVLALAMLPLRRWVLYRESFAHREDEIAIGREFAARAGPSERALIEVIDYGYFAVLAGSGRPEDFVLTGKVDPARGGEPVAAEELVRRARGQGLAYAVGRTPAEGVAGDASAHVMKGHVTLHGITPER